MKKFQPLRPQGPDYRKRVEEKFARLLRPQREVITLQEGESVEFLIISDIDDFQVVGLHRIGNQWFPCGMYASDDDGPGCSLCDEGDRPRDRLVFEVLNVNQNMPSVMMLPGGSRGAASQLFDFYANNGVPFRGMRIRATRSGYETLLQYLGHDDLGLPDPRPAHVIRRIVLSYVSNWGKGNSSAEGGE